MRREDGDPDANEPLIGRESSSLSRDDADTNQPVYTLSFRDASPVIRFLTFSAGISGLLFGFDTGVISSTLVSIGSDLSNRPLTTPDKALVTAITSLLALISAPTTGFFADRYGRKSVILVPAILFTVGAIIQSLASYVWTMAAGRALVGAAVGVASGAVPLYITELAPAELRGRLVTVQSLFITGGQVVAYLIGWIFASWPSGWRWMVGVGAIPAIVQLGLMFWMPETPRWLLQTGRDEQARAVLTKVYANVPQAERDVMIKGVLSSVQDELRAETKNGSEGTFHDAAKALIGIPGNRRALIIACMLQGLQQLCGFVCDGDWTLRQETMLTSHSELTHVLLSHHIRPGWFHVSHRNISLCRNHKFRVHTRGLCIHRHSGTPQHPPSLDSIHDPRSASMRSSISLHQCRRFANCRWLKRRRLVLRATIQHGILRRSLCCWAWNRSMAAIRAFSATGAIFGVRDSHFDELEQQLCDWNVIPTFDELPRAELNFRALCCGMCCWLGFDMEDLSGDRRA